jgi:CDP-diglyceride synthetase
MCMKQLIIMNNLLKRTIMAIPLLLLLPLLYCNLTKIKEIMLIIVGIMFCEFTYNIIKAIRQHMKLIYAGFITNELDKVSLPEIQYITLFMILLFSLMITILKSHIISHDSSYDLIKIFTLIMCSDILQYIFGKLFGNMILNNKTLWFSPNKTYEGYFFGLICSILIGKVMGFNILMTSIYIIGGVIGGIISSCAKRSLNIKDWSNLLFSHGGFIDRFDGFLIPTIILLTMDMYFEYS